MTGKTSVQLGAALQLVSSFMYNSIFPTIDDKLSFVVPTLSLKTHSEAIFLGQ
jgi:hypothetical protein